MNGLPESAFPCVSAATQPNASTNSTAMSRSNPSRVLGYTPRYAEMYDTVKAQFAEQVIKVSVRTLDLILAEHAQGVGSSRGHRAELGTRSEGPTPVIPRSASPPPAPVRFSDFPSSTGTLCRNRLQRNAAWGGRILAPKQLQGALCARTPKRACPQAVIDTKAVVGRFGLRGSRRYCTLSSPHKIFGGSPGGFDSGRSGSGVSGGRNTCSRFLLTRPFPVSFSASGFQHWEQISYSLPSISFGEHSLG